MSALMCEAVCGKNNYQKEGADVSRNLWDDDEIKMECYGFLFNVKIH
jgi:hypothetical protein